jgi:hypothetical protein
MREQLGRWVAGVTAAVAAASLWTQGIVVARLMEAGPLAVLAVMLAFFTIWSNALGLGTLALAAVRGPSSARWHGGVVSWLLLTGVVFHLLIAGTAIGGGGAPPGPFGQGLGLWAAHGLHTAVPLLALLHWWVAAPKDLRWTDAGRWLVVPLLYLAALGVGLAATGGASPYPFLDVGALGWRGVALALLGLLALTLALNLALVALALRSGAVRLGDRGRPAPLGPRPR